MSPLLSAEKSDFQIEAEQLYETETPLRGARKRSRDLDVMGPRHLIDTTNELPITIRISPWQGDSCVLRPGTAVLIRISWQRLDDCTWERHYLADIHCAGWNAPTILHAPAVWPELDWHIIANP